MTRREVREHTFRALFQKEFYNSEEYPEQYQRYLEDPVFSEDTDAAAQMDDATREYLTGRVASIAEKLPELDEKINAVARGWKTNRMGKVEVSLLRLATYEILYDEEIPEKVAINEAVALAKRYGTDDSSSFVNGILGELVKKQGQE